MTISGNAWELGLGKTCFITVIREEDLQESFWNRSGEF